MPFNAELTIEHFNSFGNDCLPGLLGITITALKENFLSAEIEINQSHFAPNGYIHAGSIVSLADTLAGYGCIAHLPENGISFTTIELKSNFLSSAKNGTIFCEAKPLHLGKATQLWDVIIKHKESNKAMALFRCTQLIIYPK
jgi:uncharacterized protein (TIGR00369 family)